MATAMGQSCGVTMSWKKGISLPFCFFFCVHHLVLMDTTEEEAWVMMSGTKISPARKNVKSPSMEASDGWDDHDVMRL